MGEIDRMHILLCVGIIITLLPFGIVDYFSISNREDLFFVIGATWGVIYVGIMERLGKEAGK